MQHNYALRRPRTLRLKAAAWSETQSQRVCLCSVQPTNHAKKAKIYL
jgi:hypothetical protein